MEQEHTEVLRLRLQNKELKVVIKELRELVALYKEDMLRERELSDRMLRELKRLRLSHNLKD